MRDFDEYDDPDGELMCRLERDEEREPRRQFALPPRRKRFRNWAGISFRPVRRETETIDLRRAS